MSDYPYTLMIALSDISLLLKCEYKETADYFASYTVSTSQALAEISASESDWDHIQRRGFARCGQIEISILTACASDVLLPYGRIIVHAAAFSFRGRAWLIAAPPGVGKSTQIRCLTELYPGEFSVICGDRPILQRMDDGSFLVHPSPWNGKEGWHGAAASPLAGILCLRRGEETAIREMKSREAVIPVFSSIISTYSSEDIVLKASAMETALLQAVPVYDYINGGVPDSSRILYSFLTEGESRNGV